MSEYVLWRLRQFSPLFLRVGVGLRRGCGRGRRDQRNNVLVFCRSRDLRGLLDLFCMYWYARCLLVLPGLAPALFLPHVPLPLFEMREAINAKEGDGAVVLIGVVRVKVDANVSIKVANIHWRVERLKISARTYRLHAAGAAHLHTTHVLPNVRTDDRPSLRISSIRLSDANRKLLENTTEELKIGKLHRVDTDILAQLDNDELRLRSPARRQHVAIPLRRQDARRGLGPAVRRVYARGTVQRRIVETVRERHAEMRRRRGRRTVGAQYGRRRVWGV